jgi:hypothetical protein
MWAVLNVTPGPAIGSVRKKAGNRCVDKNIGSQYRGEPNVVVVVALIVLDCVKKIAAGIVSIQTQRKVQPAYGANRILVERTGAAIRRRASASW